MGTPRPEKHELFFGDDEASKASCLALETLILIAPVPECAIKVNTDLEIWTLMSSCRLNRCSNHTPILVAVLH